mgnify:CR=1 FL=1
MVTSLVTQDHPRAKMEVQTTELHVRVFTNRIFKHTQNLYHEPSTSPAYVAVRSEIHTTPMTMTTPVPHLSVSPRPSLFATPEAEENHITARSTRHHWVSERDRRQAVIASGNAHG